MKTRSFLAGLDQPAILTAIREAEAKTSGEIRVFVSRRHCADALAAAERHFRHLGMTKTPHRNAVLLFVAPRSHTFALFGDVGIHQKCGPEFWQRVRDQMLPHLKGGHYTAALVHAITEAGKLLAEHFPAAAGDGNELPDGVAHD